jgi:error-prone DNA polymerase
MKCHHPDVFCAAILNAQPMGFYSTSQLVRDAKEHGVAVRPIDVNGSAWDCTLEPLDGERRAVRLGLSLTRGLAERDGLHLVQARGARPFTSVLDLSRRHVPIGALVRLAKADAFHSLGLGRREASWAIKALRDDPLPLFAEAERREQHFRPEVKEPDVTLTPMTKGRQVVEDYRSHGLTLRAHPLAFLRGELAATGIMPCADLQNTANGKRVTVSGLVMVRQRPGSAKGVIFITLEDETGIGNLIIWPSLFEKQRRTVLGAQMLGCRGKVQREGGTIHIIAEHMIDQSEMLRRLGGMDETFAIPTGRGDETKHHGRPDPRETQPLRRARDIFIPDLHIDTLKVKARDFR